MLNAHSIDTSDEQSLEINRNNLKQSLSQWQELESYFVAKNNNLDRSVHSVEDKKWMNQKANSDLTNKRNIDFAQGFGLLKFTDFYKNNITVIEESIFDGETQDTTSFQISENSRVQIILTYTDMPSALGVEKNLVNDLDLYLSLEDENKRTIKLAQSLSKTNNFEYMDLNLKPGKYKVSTDALRVLSPNGQSPYSLIVKIDTLN